MSERELRRALAQIGYLESVAFHGPDRRAQAAREGQRKRWENAVDPERVLPPAERAKRAQAAMRAQMRRMALARHLEAKQRRETRERLGYPAAR